ncbi:VWA domain-containing protein [Desulfopila sp. IMCC35006]|nr:VWA domain-containing protein [Desulfopila sp. IMCC35006]
MPVYGNTIVAESIAPHALQFQRESYNAVTENSFIATANDPLSTFSIDVDTASYANIRRWLTGGALPPVGAVRIEEMINYFSYAYPQPETGPIGITTELGPCPWQPANKLVRIGIKAKDLDPGNIPASNLVFLIDVSGSMNQANKLPLLQQSMLLLTGELTGQDRVSIVVYAGTDRVILPPTAGDQKETIRKAITSLSSGGSTHASSGIQTAYRLARQCFIKNGNNRIILASDGDFNVGVTSRDELERIVSKERQAGVFLTVLGFGMGNYHDDTMEILADRGNGNYSYIDSLLEAKKVLIKERTGTLFTLARDVKLQIEFNPARVAGYRLIGYENRALADEDFNNDNKDAGEIGAGHTVTALYELLPIGSPGVPDVDPLKYQQLSRPVDNSNEILTVKVRYKPAHSDKSLLLATAVSDNDTAFGATSADFRFAATVAGFGMLLRHSDQISGLNYPKLLTMAQNSRGTDEQGYRAEFIHLLEMSELLQDK